MTENCVRRVVETTAHRSDVEVIVVDDSSPQPLTSAAATVVRTPSNLMFAGACNFGVETSSGPNLVFLNNDTEPTNGWLDPLVQSLESCPEIAVVGSRLLHRDNTVQHAGVAFSQRDGVPRHLYRGFRADHPAVTRSKDFQAVTGACLAIRRNVFESVGGFDTAYRNGYEDIDLCLKVRERGHRVHYRGDSVLFHYESVSRRDEVAELAPEDDHNLRRFTERWLNRTHRDEVSIYAEDGLITVESGEIYPLVLRCAEELAVIGDINDRESIAALLNTRSHQVFDLEKDVGYLMGRLLDNGVEP